MALTSSPYGFQPVADQSGPPPRTVRMPSGIASGFATNIFKFQPITLNAATGLIQPVTAANQPIFGVFEGVEFTPLGGRPAVSSFWPGGTIVDPTYDFLVYFWPAWVPSYRYRVQADGSVAQPIMGQQLSITNATNGSTGTGLSLATVGAAGIAVGQQGQFVLTEFDTGVNSNPGDAFTDLIVAMAFPQVGPGFQTSIG